MCVRVSGLTQDILHHCLKYVTYLLILFVYFFSVLTLKNISKYLFRRALENTLMQNGNFMAFYLNNSVGDL